MTGQTKEKTKEGQDKRRTEQMKDRTIEELDKKKEVQTKCRTNELQDKGMTGQRNTGQRNDRTKE